MSSVRGLDYKGVPIWQRASQKRLRELPWRPCKWQEQLRRGETLRDITIIDGHAHLGEYANFFMNRPDAATMVAVMDRIGMQAAVVSANAAISSNTDFGNQMVLKAVRAFPGRFLGYVVANPYEAEEMETTLNRYLDAPGMVAIKLHPELHDDYPMIGPRYEPMWKVAAERKVPVLFHTYFGGDTLEDIARLAEKYPQTPLLVGHELQDKNLEAMAELANSFPNIYVDLSVPEIYGVTEFFYEALDDIRKLIFGTDFPWGNCHFRVGAVIYARIPEEAKRKVLGENMAELLGISLDDLVNQSKRSLPADEG
jgi:predicted TIM-barrel fold metal-dependent hydrolase